jgi:hypothetical protein
LRARKWVNQKKEILMRVLTHNLMLLAAAYPGAAADVGHGLRSFGFRRSSVRGRVC